MTASKSDRISIAFWLPPIVGDKDSSPIVSVRFRRARVAPYINLECRGPFLEARSAHGAAFTLAVRHYLFDFTSQLSEMNGEALVKLALLHCRGASGDLLGIVGFCAQLRCAGLHVLHGPLPWRLQTRRVQPICTAGSSPGSQDDGAKSWSRGGVFGRLPIPTLSDLDRS
jgi:hypothetical protein